MTQRVLQEKNLEYCQLRSPIYEFSDHLTLNCCFSRGI